MCWIFGQLTRKLWHERGLLKRLYGRFEQENIRIAKKHGGSGLGLAITKDLVELMHG